MKNKIRWMWGISLLLAGMLIMVSDMSAYAQAKRVKVLEAHTGTLFMAPVYIAEAAGYMAEEGIDLELTEVDSGALGIAALVSGGVQLVDADPFQLVQLLKQGKSVQFLYNLTKGVTLDMVMSKEVIAAKNLSRSMPIAQRFAALKGMKLGITKPGAATDVYMRYYLKRAGIDPERDVQIVTVGGGAALLASMKTKQIDAFHLSPPTPYQVQQAGFGDVIIKASAGDVPELTNFLYTGIAVTKEYAEKNADVLKRWTRAVNKANALMQKDEAASIKYLQKYFPRMDPAVMTLAMREIIPALSPNGVMNEQMVQKHLDFLRETKQVDSVPSAKEGVLWTNAYVK
jgi:ABC-type nitrate/sulfonate/bicarbonate transport system substrate-binding protein